MLVRTCVKIQNLNIVGWSLIKLHYREQVLGLGKFENLIQKVLTLDFHSVNLVLCCNDQLACSVEKGVTTKKV